MDNSHSKKLVINMSVVVRKNFKIHSYLNKGIGRTTSTTPPLIPFYYHWYYKYLSNLNFFFPKKLMGVGLMV